MEEKEEKKESFDIVIAIDFGTSGCGFAISSFLGNQEIYTDQQWPGSSQPHQKVPTTIILDQNKSLISFGYAAKKKYLEDEECDKKYYLFEYFKMSLYENKNQSRPMSKSIDGNLFPTEDLIALTLSEVKQHSLNKSKFVCQRSNPRILWVITVPAIWSPKDRQIMRQAATKAGMENEKNTILIALEPECASLWIQHTQELRFEKGLKYVIADLGGGTADITVHEIIDSNHVRELCPASGGNWGSSYINKEFEKLLCMICGNETIDKFKKKYPQAWYALMENFERNKRGIEKVEENSSFELTTIFTDFVEGKDEDKEDREERKILNFKRLVSDCSERLRQQEIILNYYPRTQKLSINSKGVRKLLFSSAAGKTIDHIKELLSREKLEDECKYIFLVGGLSMSSYIQEEFKKEFGDKVIAALRPEVAVVSGAVLFGKQPDSILERVCPTLGFETTKLFNGKDQLHIKAIERKKLSNDGARVEKLFAQYTSAGDRVRFDHVISKFFAPVKGNQKQMEFHLYSSTQKQVEFVDDPGCRILGNYTVELPSGDREDMLIKMSMIFGQTEISIKAINSNDRTVLHSQLNFVNVPR